MPVSQANVSRLLAYDFDSQIRSLLRSRFEEPEKLVAWFRHWESNVEAFRLKYGLLNDEHKEKLSVLQRVYEVLSDRPFVAVPPRNLQSLGLQHAFQILPDLVKVVAQKLSNGLLVVGPGGVGKSYTVMETLRDSALEEGMDFFRVPGYASPLGLYSLLWERQNKLIVFDDCDAIFRDEHGINILKSVLDTLPCRLVSWRSAHAKVPVPEFTFSGQIIFISNMDPNKSTNPHFQALLTRVMTLVVGSSKEEILMHIVSKMPVIAADLDFA
jgi:hypothetical protein